MIYIDFDGVILDTEELLFEKWRMNPNRYLLPESEKIKYIQNIDWRYILYNSPIINDSIYYLKQLDPSKSFILTKVHSLTNEANNKIKWSRDNGIKQPVIIVPYTQKKTDLVPVKGNLLVDDSLKNLDEWVYENGEVLFFDKDNDNYDSWNEPNTKGYQKVLNLSSLIK